MPKCTLNPDGHPQEEIVNPKLVVGQVIVITSYCRGWHHSPGDIYIVSDASPATGVRIVSLANGVSYRPTGLISNCVGFRVLGPADKLVLEF